MGALPFVEAKFQADFALARILAVQVVAVEVAIVIPIYTGRTWNPVARKCRTNGRNNKEQSEDKRLHLFETIKQNYIKNIQEFLYLYL